jgi:antitoxin ParD1/3/4
MPNQDALPPEPDAVPDDRQGLESLRRAVAVGIADIEAGRFRTFSSARDLGRHLASLTQDLIRSQSRAAR